MSKQRQDMDTKTRRAKSPSGSNKSKKSLRERILEGQMKQATASQLADTDLLEEFLSPSSKLMDLDPTMSEGDLPRSIVDTDDDLSVGSQTSRHSRMSILPIQHKRGAGVAMDEATKLANETLQKAKSAIEEAGNMKRECKTIALECLQTLYETTLALSDSRSRHKYNLEKEKSRNALELVRIERAHTKEMNTLKENLAAEINNTRKETQAIAKETENIMKWLNFETRRPFKEMEEAGAALKNIERQLKSPKKTGETLEKEKWEHLNTEIKRLNNNTNSISNQLDTLRRHINDIHKKYDNLPLLQLGKDKQPEYCQPEPAMTNIITELQEMKDLIKNLHGLSVTPNKTDCTTKHENHISQAWQDTIKDLKEQIRELKDPYLGISSNILDLKRTITDSTETTAELISPIRTSIEELKNKIKETDNQQDITQDLQQIKNTTNKTVTLITPLKSVIDDLHKKPKKDVDDEPEGVKDRHNKITYAEVAKTRGTNYKLCIASSDKHDTSEDILNTVKSNLNVVDLGLGIKTVRKIANQKLIIGCNTSEDREKMRKELETNKNLKLQKLANKNPLIKLIGIINDFPNSKIPEALVKQNKDIEEEDIQHIKVIRRTRGRTKETTNVIIETSPKVWNKLEGNRIHIGFQVVPAVDQSPLIQCFNCLQFGHTAKVCSGAQTCGYCAQGHDTRECPNKNGPPKCANCTEGAHPAYSSECALRRRWDRIARDKVSYC